MWSACSPSTARASTASRSWATARCAGRASTTCASSRARRPASTRRRAPAALRIVGATSEARSRMENSVVHLVRHGQVHNPDGVLYGRTDWYFPAINGSTNPRFAGCLGQYTYRPLACDCGMPAADVRPGPMVQVLQIVSTHSVDQPHVHWIVAFGVLHSGQPPEPACFPVRTPKRSPAFAAASFCEICVDKRFRSIREAAVAGHYWLAAQCRSRDLYRRSSGCSPVAAILEYKPCGATVFVFRSVDGVCSASVCAALAA